MRSKAETYDVVVLGGGTAYRIADKVARAGRSVALVEADQLGGTCPNRDCIPSKLLIAHAHAANAVRRAGDFHVEAELRSIDGEKVLRDSFQYTAGTDRRFAERLPEGATLVRGRGRFVGERTLDVGGRRLRGDVVVIATGSRPRLPDARLLPRDAYWTSDDVFDLQRLPESIAVVGGGLVGCELASFFAGVGVRTQLVERGHELLKGEDEDVRHLLRDALHARVELHLGTEVVSVTADDDQRLVTLSTRGQRSATACDALLFAIGRRPNTDDLGLAEAGVDLDDDGYVRVDDCLRTSAPDVYALGDVIGRYPYTHAASHEAHYLVRRLLEDLKEPVDYGPMPHAVFTDPPIAAVGPTEAELRERGVDHVAVSVPFDHVPMGHAVRERHGLCKLLVARDGKILGAHLIGHEAPTLVHELLPVMRWHDDVRALASLIHIHPALNEVVQAAAREAVTQLERDRRTPRNDPVDDDLRIRFEPPTSGDPPPEMEPPRPPTDRPSPPRPEAPSRPAPPRVPQPSPAPRPTPPDPHAHR